MPKWLIVSGHSIGSAVVFGNTEYNAPCGLLWLGVATEIRQQYIARDSYTWADLLVKITANTLDGTTTVKSRVDAGDGNQSVSILTTQTGTFQDTVNSDTLTDGELFCYEFAAAGTEGEITATIISSTLETASNTTPIIGFCYAYQVEGAGSTQYEFLMGGDSQGAASQVGDPTEAWTHYTFRASATLTNLRVYGGISSIDTLTFVSRVNGGNGNLTISIPDNTTGAYEDTTHNDSISSGDEVNYRIVCGAATGSGRNIYLYNYQVKSNSTGRQTACAMPWTSPTIDHAVTGYFAIEGDTVETATEANAQCLTRMAFVAKNFFVNIKSNTVNAARIINTRINGGDGSLTVSITAATTGIFEDLSNTDTLIATDLYNYKIASAGSLGSTKVGIIGFEQQQPAAPPPGLENKSANMGSKMVAAGLI